MRHGVRLGDDVARDQFGHGLVLVDDGEAQMCFFDGPDQRQRVPLEEAIIQVVVGPVPVNQDAIHARQLHQQDVAIQRIGVARIVQPHQWIEVGGSLAPPVRHGVGVKVVHGPGPPPPRTGRLGLEPRHIVGHEVAGLVGERELARRRRGEAGRHKQGGNHQGEQEGAGGSHGDYDT